MRLAPASNDAYRGGARTLAYWLNGYNALVLAGVLDRGVDTPSVWGDGLFGIGFFTPERGALGGRRISLKTLEDEIVRGRLGDPRVHAALNCASRGCPRLPRLAFERASGNPRPRVLDYVNRYRGGSRLDPAFRVRYLPYDEGLNRR